MNSKSKFNCSKSGMNQNVNGYPKMEEEDSFVQLAVGEIRKEYKIDADGVLVNIDDYGIVTTIMMNRITQDEEKQFDSSQSLEVRFVQIRGVIFFLYKFGSLKWMDAPYITSVEDNKNVIPDVEEGTGLAHQIIVADSHAGKIVSMRIVGMSTNFTRKLKEAIDIQNKMYANKEEAYAEVVKIYKAYSTKKLVQFSNTCCKFK